MIHECIPRMAKKALKKIQKQAIEKNKPISFRLIRRLCDLIAETRQLSEEIQIYGEEQISKRLKELRQKYVSVALDAGKIGGVPYVFCVVYELNSNNPPFLLRLDQIVGTSEGYATLAFEICKQLWQSNIFLASFVTDGCIAQVSGLDLSSENSFANLLDTNSILPFHCPCACHLTQLVFKNAFEQCQFFTEEINLLHLLATELRKDVFAKLIGARCPAP
ncbi:MAG: hypothetical protein EZS28_037394, partial [Streblomastix strix]